MASNNTNPKVEFLLAITVVVFVLGYKYFLEYSEVINSSIYNILNNLTFYLAIFILLFAVWYNLRGYCRIICLMKNSIFSF